MAGELFQTSHLTILKDIGMPPRKSAQPDSVITVQPKASLQDRNENVSEETQRSLDRWTDEQEIALLKAVVRWKPVGPSLRDLSVRISLTFDMTQACINTFASSPSTTT